MPSSYQTTLTSKVIPTSINALSFGTSTRPPFHTHLTPYRWKQRDIHEKREIRKARIAFLRNEIDCNNILIPRFKSISASLSSPPDGLSPEAFYNQTVEKLQTHPSDAKPPTGNPQQKTYDAIVLEVLLKVVENVKSAAGKEGDVGARLKAEIDNNVVQMVKRNGEHQNELETEEKEQKKHITSEDLKDGFDSKVRTRLGSDY